MSALMGTAGSVYVNQEILPPPELRFMGESDELFLPMCDHLATNVLRSVAGTCFDVLDVGCGYGRLAYGLRRAGFEGTYRGFDILRRQIDWLAENFATSADDPRYRFDFINVHNARYNPVGLPFNTLTFPYAAGTFDCITAFSVFTHMYEDDIRQYLRRLAPLLREGGVCIATFFSVPETFTLAGQSDSMRYRLTEQISPHAFIHDPSQPLHVIAYREAFVRALIEAEGLEVLSHRPGAWLEDADAGEFQDWFVLRRRSSASVKEQSALSVCNICGGTEFGRGPSGRLSATRIAPHCYRCGSLERQRIGRRIFQALPTGFLHWRRCLQFSPDQSSDPRWFRSYELSIYGGEGGLDIQAIDRADASYDFVTLSHVLECIPRDLGAFDELVRIIAPHGILHLSVSGALTRERSIDHARAIDPYGTLHLYGRDVYQRFGCAQKRLGMLIVEGEDPVTGVRDVMHLFTRHAPDIRRLRAWMESWDPSITIIDEVRP